MWSSSGIISFLKCPKQTQWHEYCDPVFVGTQYLGVGHFYHNDYYSGQCAKMCD